MDKKLIATFAYIGLSAVGGYAIAQDNPERQSNHPANERMEKGNPAHGVQRPMNNPGAARNDAENSEPRSGQANEKREEPRMGQANEKVDEPRANEKEQPQTGRADERKGEQPRMGQNNEKREVPRIGQTNEIGEQPRTGQANEQRTDPRSGQSAANGERNDSNNAGDGARNVRVNGNLHVSEDNAAEFPEPDASRPQRKDQCSTSTSVRRCRAMWSCCLCRATSSNSRLNTEGYDYVVVNDEIVFVQPSTRKVVGMIVAGGEDPDRHLAGARPCPVD